jgi:hypothetical protein
VGIPFVDGILGHNLLLSQAFSVGIPLWMGFRLSRSLFSQTLLLFIIEFWLSGSPSHEDFFSFSMESRLSRSPFHESFFYDGVLDIKVPFTRTFLFSRWNSGYQGAFHTNFSFFSRWNSGYQGAFHTNFSFFFTMEFWLSWSLSYELFFFHDGILAIEEPFTRTFLFSRWNSGYQGAFYTNFSFFTMEFSKCTIWGRLFSYIYHKEYLHMIRLVKNLAS